MSVRLTLGCRFRHWYSPRYLRIPPLHREFYTPLIASSLPVFNDLSQLSRELSQKTYPTAYLRFTPSDSEYRLPPTYYRGCWHVVSRDLFFRYRPFSSLKKGVYDPRAFILHAALLHQTFVHCAIFLTAAPRRSRDRVSVPV